MPRNLVVDSYRWYDQIKREEPGEVVLQAILDRIAKSRNAEEVRILKGILSSELASQERYNDAERVRKELANDFPADPSPLISLAEQKLYYEHKPAEAMESIDQALERAMRTGNFRRQALGVKARISISLGRYDIVEDILRQLMTLQLKPGNLDIGLEWDFIHKIPLGVIDKGIADQFEEYIRSAR